jgi:hypothetical protein
MPRHAAWTMFRNVSDFLYARKNAAPSATTAAITRPIGFRAIVPLRTAWIVAQAAVAPWITATASA